MEGIFFCEDAYVGVGGDDEGLEVVLVAWKKMDSSSVSNHKVVLVHP